MLTNKLANTPLNKLRNIKLAMTKVSKDLNFKLMI